VHNNPIRYKDPTGHAVVGGNGGPGYAQLANKLGEKISSAVDSVKNFFSGGGQIKVNAENKLNQAKGNNTKFQKGDVSPSGNGIIKDIFEYKASERYPNDHSGKVYITESNKEPNTKFWEKFEGKLEHWYKKDILSKEKSETMFDIGKNKHRSGASDFYGPGSDFKIKRAGLSAGYGGRIDVETADGKIVTLGHFTEISSKIMDAAKSGDSLPAGTYLGETYSTIGSSSGPHVHGEGKKGIISEHRDQTLKSLIKKE
jgi:hypothetical protein